MFDSPITKKTLREQMAEVLRKKILGGEIKPGERIVEADIAKELQISRGPVREALRQIEEEGLVSYKSHKGCVVKTISYEEMQEAYLIRSTLEALAVQMCSGQLPEGVEDKMEQCLVKMREAAKDKDLYRVVKLDEEFHSYIVLASHFDQLYRVWKSLESGNMTAYYTMETESLMPYEYIERNHRRILDVFRT